MWIPIRAGVKTNVNVVVSDLIRRRYGRTAARVVSNVARPLAAFRLDAPDASFRQEGEVALSKWRACFRMLVAALARSPRHESDAVLSYALKVIVDLNAERGPIG